MHQDLETTTSYASVTVPSALRSGSDVTSFVISSPGAGCPRTGLVTTISTLGSCGFFLRSRDHERDLATCAVDGLLSTVKVGGPQLNVSSTSPGIPPSASVSVQVLPVWVA